MKNDLFIYGNMYGTYVKDMDSIAACYENREYMIKIFPGLEKYWDMDGGETFLQVFFEIYYNKAALYNRWRSMKYYGEKAVPFAGLDVVNLRLRLVADEDDFRPYFSFEQEELLENLDEAVVGGPVLLGDEDTLRILELCLTRKTTDEVNVAIMEERLRHALELRSKI